MIADEVSASAGPPARKRRAPHPPGRGLADRRPGPAARSRIGPASYCAGVPPGLGSARARAQRRPIASASWRRRAATAGGPTRGCSKRGAGRTQMSAWRSTSLIAIGWALAALGAAGEARADLSASQVQAMAQEAVLLAKPAVALVTARVDAEVTVDCGNGQPVKVNPPPYVETGTGWFVDGRGYLVTNAHVVDPAQRVPAWVTKDLAKQAVEKGCIDPGLSANDAVRGERPDLENQLRALVHMSDVVVAPRTQVTVLLSNGKALDAAVRKFSPPISLDASGAPSSDSGRDLALLQVPEGVYPALALTHNPPALGHTVHIIGFPGVVLHHELLNKSAYVEASITSGTVSGFKQDALGQSVIQTDAPAAPGNSGGPAIGNRGHVLGVLTFVTLSTSGESVQGFNFLIPASDVQKFLAGTDVKVGQSRWSPVWQAGLRDLAEGRYKRAAQRFAEAEKLLPGLPDVKRAAAEAQDKIQHPPPQPFPWAWTTLGVTLVSLGVYGGMAGRHWWKGRHRIQPSHVIEMIGAGQAPVLVDARRQEDYDASPLELLHSVRLSPDDAEAGRIALQVQPEQMVVVYCASPDEATSARVATLLRARGFKHVRVLKGGIGSWTNAGLPVATKSSMPSLGVEIYRNLTAREAGRRRLRAGDVIVGEGDPDNDEAYVVHSGRVDIRQRTNGGERLLTTLGEGELFGEMALFRSAARSATAVAATDVELLVIRRERLEWLIRNRPQLTLEILRRLSDLLAKADHATR